MRYFNTAGPIQTDIHYFLPPLERLNKDEILRLIAARKYFILHAPRQTGKTTVLLALTEELNRSGQYRAIYANVEVAQTARDDVHRAMRAILGQLADAARLTFGDEFIRERMNKVLDEYGAENALNAMLTQWAEHNSLPTIVMLDEIDAMVGDSLVSTLRQLRAGYPNRPQSFPQSVILCGVRDVRDYRIRSSKTQEIITGGSAFNVKAKSLRLGDFAYEEMVRLYRQHTAETGQIFEDDVFPLAWELTGGQPWLVNALAYEACFEMAEGRDHTRPITVETIEQAKENLILRRDTHLDQLADKLQEDRVRRIIEPVLAGAGDPKSLPPDDISYVRDLGLITTRGEIRIANRIYQEVIPRELTWSTQATIVQEPWWYTTPDGRLDMIKLLAAFQQFFREHSEHWVERFDYKEAGPQLLLQAFLQRIINGGGRIEREYGLGRKRTDLLLIWNYSDGAQRVVLELKVGSGASETLIREGLEQTAGYMDRCGAVEGHLILFDRNPNRTWEEKIFHRAEVHAGRTIEVWGM
ncbi:MAG: ATP-binding protein [Acidobacteria bacterium]|nr:ATP-binding protein [Acidobacteriota bacterium]